MREEGGELRGTLFVMIWVFHNTLTAAFRQVSLSRITRSSTERKNPLLYGLSSTSLLVLDERDEARVIRAVEAATTRTGIRTGPAVHRHEH